MALINKLDNTASVTYGGAPVNSNTVSTLLLLPPVLTKLVDKLTASVGEILTYTVTILNDSLQPLNNLPFTDVLPVGSTYVPDSFKVNGTPAAPAVTTNTLTYNIPSIAAAATTTIEYQVTVVGGSL